VNEYKNTRESQCSITIIYLYIKDCLVTWKILMKDVNNFLYGTQLLAMGYPGLNKNKPLIKPCKWQKQKLSNSGFISLSTKDF